jgi:hypothetical protein
VVSTFSPTPVQEGNFSMFSMFSMSRSCEKVAYGIGQKKFLETPEIENIEKRLLIEPGSTRLIVPRHGFRHDCGRHLS